MNEENGKHEFNFFLDKELQQKLLEANEDFLEKEFTSSLSQNNTLQSSNSTNKNNNVNSGAQSSHKLPKYQDCVHVCGWCPNPNTVYRKSESHHHGDAPPRSKGHLAVTRESLYSRDSKSRPQHIDNFVFRHYSDPRKYIEQYRKEHACYDSTNSSATKHEFLETRRFYAYNQYSPLAVGSNSSSSNTLHQPNSYVPQPQLDPPVQSNDTITKSHNQQTPSLQYTNRREQKKNTISANLNAKNPHQYKLTKTPPNSNKNDRVGDYTEEYIESLEINKKQRHSGSAKERSSPAVNGLGIQKSSATKINVPSANFGGKPLRTANVGANSENTLPSHMPSSITTGKNTTGRMLDTLACVAGNGSGVDKQPQLPSLPNNNNNHQNNPPSKSGTPSSSKKRPTIGSASTICTSISTLAAPTPTIIIPTENTYYASTTPTPATAATPIPPLPTNNTNTILPTSSSSSFSSHATPAFATPRIAFANNNTAMTMTNNSSKNNDDDDDNNCNNNDNYGNKKPSSKNNNNDNFINDNRVKSKNNCRNNNKSSNKISNENDDSSSTTSEVSISQLSTTCLGADVNVKSRPKLEASKTYHIFQNEFSTPSITTTNTTTTNASASNQHHLQKPGQMLSVVWNPGKSAVVDKRQRSSPRAINNLTADMLNMTGPFRNSPRRPATQEGGYRAVEFVTKEFIQDAKPLNLRTTDVFRDVARMSAAGLSNINMSPGLKTNTIKPDLPSTFSLQGLPKKPQFEILKKKKRPSNTAVVGRVKKEHHHNNNTPDQDGGRKSWSASTDASNQSTSGGGSSALRLKPVRGDAFGESTANTNEGGNGTSTTLPVPYFKFWNSSLPPKSREGRRRGGGGHGVGGSGGGGLGGGGLGDRMMMSADIDMQELAAMVLADETGNEDTDLRHAAKRVLEVKHRSDTEQGIATGGSGVPPSGDRTSKEELLESLRSVNQRPPKSSPRPLHLTYYTGDVTPDNCSNSTPLTTTTRHGGNGGGRRVSQETEDDDDDDDDDDCRGGQNSSQPQQRPRRKHQQLQQKQHKSPRRKEKELSNSYTASSPRQNNAATTTASIDCNDSSKHGGEENTGNSNGYPSDSTYSGGGGGDDRVVPLTLGNRGIDDDKSESENYVSSTTRSKKHQQSQNHPKNENNCVSVRKETIFVSQLEGEELLSSAKNVNVDDDDDGDGDDDSHFMSRLSSWKQICAEYNYRDSAFFLREAKNKEYKHLIAKKFDRRSSLSHQRRIKHLIEQSRLKSHLGNASRLHLAYSIGDAPDHRFIDIKTGGINTSSAEEFKRTINNGRGFKVSRNHRMIEQGLGDREQAKQQQKKKKSSKLKIVNIITPTTATSQDAHVSTAASGTAGSASKSKEGKHDNSLLYETDEAEIFSSQSPGDPPTHHHHHCVDDFEGNNTNTNTARENSKIIGNDNGMSGNSTKTKNSVRKNVHVVPCGIVDPAHHPDGSSSSPRVYCGENGDGTLSLTSYCSDVVINDETSSRLSLPTNPVASNPNSNKLRSFHESTEKNDDVINKNEKEKDKNSQKKQPTAASNSNCQNTGGNNTGNKIGHNITKNTTTTSRDNDYCNAGDEDANHYHYSYHDQTTTMKEVNSEFEHFNNGHLIINGHLNSHSHSHPHAQKPHSNKLTNSNYPSGEMFYKKMSGVEHGYVDYNFHNKANTNNSITNPPPRPLIPLIYGTAIGDPNHSIKSGHLFKNSNKSYNMSSSVSSKPTTKLSPLTEPHIEMLANKMAVKINTTKLKYTKSREVERSQSMHL